MKPLSGPQAASTVLFQEKLVTHTPPNCKYIALVPRSGALTAPCNLKHWCARYIWGLLAEGSEAFATVSQPKYPKYCTQIQDPFQIMKTMCRIALRFNEFWWCTASIVQSTRAIGLSCRCCSSNHHLKDPAISLRKGRVNMAWREDWPCLAGLLPQTSSDVCGHPHPFQPQPNCIELKNFVRRDRAASMNPNSHKGLILIDVIRVQSQDISARHLCRIG